LEPLLKFYASRWALLFSLIAMIACSLGFNELQMRLGADIIDVLRGGYDADTVQERFLIYGEAGRALYARATLSLDVFYPLAYSTFFACLIVMGAVSPHARYLVIIPIVVALLDLGENISIYMLLTNFPDISDAQIARASTLTVAKWWAVVLMLVVAFGQLFVRLTMLTIGQSRR
jgi:hypothetical protein